MVPGDSAMHSADSPVIYPVGCLACNSRTVRLAANLVCCTACERTMAV